MSDKDFYLVRFNNNLLFYVQEISTLPPSDQLDCHSFGYDVIQDEERAGLVIISESRNFLLKCDDEIGTKMW